MKNKREKEKDKKKSHDSYTHKSQIKCFKCKSNAHKSNEYINKIVLMLRAKGLCGYSKEVLSIFLKWNGKTRSNKTLC